jgi:hypothetical protein
MKWVCTECGSEAKAVAPPSHCPRCGDSSFVRWQGDAVDDAASHRKGAVSHELAFPNGGLFSPGSVLLS